jgi:23S rRNA (guanosine2251-2'-O)-methyltransferase
VSTQKPFFKKGSRVSSGEKRHFSSPPRGKRGSGAKTAETDMTILYGWHPVLEALKNENRVIRRLLATENAARRLQEEGPSPLKMEPHIVRASEIDHLLETDAVHQGLYMEADPLPSQGLEDLGADAMVIVLDQVTDPHNVGAILRSAAAFGAAAIITTQRHSPSVTGVLAKSASGALEHVPIITVGNLAQALSTLEDMGFQRIGFDSEGSVSLSEVKMALPLALVMGAEGKGLRHLTQERCNIIARLDMPGTIKSLNVSNAAAVAMYAVILSEN